MVDAIIREMDLAGGFLKGAADSSGDGPGPGGRAGAPPVGTVYLGGGTPSLLPVAGLQRLMDAVRTHYDVDHNAEVTLEANPDDIGAGSLDAWKHAGINRLSIGVQSFRDADLHWMNRAHNAGQAREAIRLARAAGFDHDSIDLIFGTPGLSDAALLENLAEAIGLGCPHLSCYALTVEPKTALDKDIRRGKLPPVDPEIQARQFLLVMETLQKAGYEHYEISNFALPGHRSRHNSSYWQGVPYLGLGPSAHSFDGQNRRWNVSNNALYLQAIAAGAIPFEEETLTPTQRLNEYIMISIRTMEGLDLERVEKDGGTAKREEIELQTEPFVAKGWIRRDGAKRILTKEGKLFADGIASALFS
jgi:oxygen-independent coproporphyrinogen-3 oxidase